MHLLLSSMELEKLDNRDTSHQDNQASRASISQSSFNERLAKITFIIEITIVLNVFDLLNKVSIWFPFKHNYLLKNS